MEKTSEKTNNVAGLNPSSATKVPCTPCTTIDIPLRHTCSPSCWKRRTFLERTLIILLVVMVMVVIAMVIIAVTWPGRTDGTTNICLTGECARIAARVIDAMDNNVDPCDDFFEHACGTWNRVNPIPDDKSVYNTFRKLNDEIQGELGVLFEERVTENETLATQKVKHIYKSCMNTSLLETRQEKPLIDLLEWLGGWPITNKTWDGGSFDLEETLVKLRLINNRCLFNMGVGPDDKNSNVNIIMVDQTNLGMPSRDYYLKGRNDKTLAAYEDMVINVAIALGAEPELAAVEMAEMVDFEIQLANLTIAEENRRDAEKLYQLHNISSLRNIVSRIDWLRYFQMVFSEVDINITESEKVVSLATKYLTELGELLERTPNRTLANYLIWNVVMSRINNLNQRFLELKRNFHKALQGTDQEQARWRLCVNYVNDNFGMAVGRLFVSRYFDERSKINALEMIKNIRDAFIELLNEVPWMDEPTKVVAKEKAVAIQERIGYPDYIMNDTALNLDYEEVNIDPDLYFENVVSILKVGTKSNLRKLRRSVDKIKWATAPAIVNAFYSATLNQIMFPAGILQPPFYHDSYPKYIQYSGIAIAVAHEITHGFDDEGRQYDKDGNLKQWWSDSVIERFKDKAQCIIDQYSNYTVKEAGINLNGKQTQGENIADNGGLKQAFRAYTRWLERTGTNEKLLPGLELTHKQLFFLNFAQIWCGTARPESQLQSIRTGRHSPGRFRVIGVLSNSKDFAEAYKCPLGSNMNPQRKCSVW